LGTTVPCQVNSAGTQSRVGIAGVALHETVSSEEAQHGAVARGEVCERERASVCEREIERETGRV